MFKYEVGECVESFKNHQEGVLFDVNDSGIVMVIFSNNPTSSEIEQFHSGNSFEIRFIELHEVIMITCKIGNLNWVDAPFTAYLSQNLTVLSEPKNEKGYSLTLLLVDSITGTIKHIRLIGLNNRFSKSLYALIKKQMDKPFNLGEYDKRLKMIFSAYSTKQIVKMSRDYCKINS